MRGRHVLLLTDYDGTLAAIAPTPAEAVISADLQADIAEVEALPSVTFGVVSGRRLTDVRERVGPAVEFVAGLHGLEVVGPTSKFDHHALDAAVPVVKALLKAARKKLGSYPGIYFEDKKYALTCHVRLTPAELRDRALEEFMALAAPRIESGILKPMAGAKALEMLPASDWDKGRAVEWIRARVSARVSEPVAVIYLGDDRTDEDAFRALSDEDVAIGVGERPEPRHIHWRFEGPPAVHQFLEHFVHLRQRG